MGAGASAILSTPREFNNADYYYYYSNLSLLFTQKIVVVVVVVRANDTHSRNSGLALALCTRALCCGWLLLLLLLLLMLLLLLPRSSSLLLAPAAARRLHHARLARATLGDGRRPQRKATAGGGAIAHASSRRIYHCWTTDRVVASRESRLATRDGASLASHS